jgi:uncharacterized protein
MNTPRSVLRLNVGFLINQSVGTSRDFLFEYQNLSLGTELDLQDLHGSARVTRTVQGLLLQVKMQTFIDSECVRCLTAIRQPLAVDFTELFAFTLRTASESGLILPENGHIDLAPLLREYLLLEIPINPLCRPDCRGLCPICGEALGDESHQHEDDSIDPRLEELKALLEKKSSQ